MARFVFLLIGFIFLLSSYVEGRIVSTHERVKRQMNTAANKWTGGQMNYFFDGKNNQRQTIMRYAMRWISDRTCIRFKEDAKAKQRVEIFLDDSDACSSKVGAPDPFGSYIYGINTGNCTMHLGVFVHELMHSLGSAHEQSRLDRNSWLITNPENILLGTYNHHLDPYAERIVPFDYGSTMMYAVFGYGNTQWQIPTEPEYKYTMGNYRPTFYDMERINLFYNCKCPVTLPCQNNGITSPGDCTKCFCPNGFFGRLCNQRRNTDSYELSATNQWIMKTIEFKYKFTGDNYAHTYSTFAYIKAPPGRKIQVKIGKLNGVECFRGCRFQGVEVKTKDNRLTSPIACCSPEQTLANRVISGEQEFLKKEITSRNNPTIIEMYSRLNYTSSVVFFYRFV